MKSQEYWAKRESEALKNRITDEKEYDAELKRIYDNMLDACQKEIDSFYGKYASKEGITIAEAKKRVSKLDIEAYERKAKRYVRDKDFSAQANEEMRLYNLTMKANRLEMLKANIGLELISGHDEIEKFMGGILKGRTEDELKRQAGILGKTVTNNAKKADAIVNGSFKVDKVGGKSTFSDYIWMYQDTMKADLSKLLQSGLIQGKNPRAIAKDLKKYWYGADPKTGGGALYCTERLMRTELARVQTEAQKQSLERNGFDMYEFICNENPSKHNTCDICKGLNGKHFKVIDMMPGKNAPPMHPNCRCSTAAWSDDAEYEAWLDYLDKGGTTEEWNKLKESSAKVETKQNVLKSSFNPAKSIAEAEEYAKQQGVKYADFSKLPLETANALNEALTTLPEDVRPVFMGASTTLEQYWGGKLPRSSKNYYGVTIQTFDGIHLGYGKGWDDVDGYMVGISSSYKTATKITEAKAKSQAIYKQKHNGQKWFFNEMGESTPFHEMGHVYLNIKGMPEGFEQDAMKWAKESGCDMLNKPSEAWAEAWAAYHRNSSDLPEYISKYIQKASANNGKATKSAKMLTSFDDDVIMNAKIEEFSKKLRDGKIGTVLSKQKQSRHILTSKEFATYSEKLAKNGDHPAYIREDLSFDDLSNMVKDKLGTGIIEIRKDDSVREFLDFDDIVGMYYDKSSKTYKPTKRVQISYAIGDGNIHIIPVKEK